MDSCSSMYAPCTSATSFDNSAPERKGATITTSELCPSTRLEFAKIASALDARSRRPEREAVQCDGFTLLELLVVIVIIGLLASYVGPKYFSQLGKSTVAVAGAQIAAFEKALDAYRIDVGRYPSTEEGLVALQMRPAGASHWNGPYLKKEVPLDPWGHPYVYRSPSSKADFIITSYGKDGRPGGTGEDADVTNQ